MTPTRPSILLALAAAVGVVSWLFVRVEYDSLPTLPKAGPVSLVLLAGFELVYGLSVRSRIRNPGDRPLEPLFVAKLAVLAKASSHAAAIIAGLYGGFFAYTVTNLGRGRFNDDTRASGLSVVASLVLVGAALFLENSCRVPRDSDDRTK
jgi:hypothetical protein